MPFEDAIIDIIAWLIILGFPFLVLLLFVSPLAFIKLRKKKFTALNVFFSLIIGAALAAGAIYMAYWGLAYLQGLAFLEYHGFK